TFSPDSKVLASACEFIDSKSRAVAGEVRLWNLGSGRMLRSISFKSPTQLYRVAFSEDGKLLATSLRIYDRGARTFQGEIKLWDVTTGNELRIFPGNLVAFSPDGRTLAVGTNQSLKLMDGFRGQELRSLRGRGIHGLISFGCSRRSGHRY